MAARPSHALQLIGLTTPFKEQLNIFGKASQVFILPAIFSKAGSFIV